MNEADLTENLVNSDCFIFCIKMKKLLFFMYSSSIRDSYFFPSTHHLMRFQACIPGQKKKRARAEGTGQLRCPPGSSLPPILQLTTAPVGQSLAKCHPPYKLEYVVFIWAVLS